MNLAFLGADAWTLLLAQCAARGGHQIVWAGELSPPAAEAFRNFAPGTPIEARWEHLLSGIDADWVIVAPHGDPEYRAEQLRKLVAAGVPLAVSHPVHPSMLVYFELEMIRSEGGAALRPLTPAVAHPALARMAACFDGTGGWPLGRLQQVILERQLPTRRREEVQRAFAEDMLTAQRLAGPLNRLGALAPPGDPWENLGVQVSGPGGVLVRWSVAPVERFPVAKLTARAEGGRVVLEMPESGPWQLDVVLQGEDEPAASDTFEPLDAAQAALAALETGTLSPKTDWPAAARCVELAETIERSLARGRTIELHDEEYSEEHTFKGKMSALGCGLLILGLIVGVIGVIAGGLGVRGAHVWPYALLVVFVAFLALQLLRLALPARQ